MLESPLFPGYVFERIRRNERVGVLEAPGAVSQLGSASQPASLQDFEVETPRMALNPESSESHPVLTAGERARMKNEPLAGMGGMIVRKKGGYRVVFTLDLLMQSLAIELAIEIDGDDVEPENASFPLKLEDKPKEIKQPERIPLYQFNCLDTSPERTQVAFPVRSLPANDRCAGVLLAARR